jgi:penicillin amidase
VYSGFAVFAAFAFLTAGGCNRTTPPPPPLAAQVSGTIEIAGLSAPVRIVRDTWGVPHIRAESQDDLFVAQGFVQAQDRLFQMDLWRRSVQGRLSQVLGPNFIERDAMTRRVQYRGPLDVEWESYGADARVIAEAFVRGINAWVAIARANPPEEFTVAGWKPEFWSAVDLLNRTDAFQSSGDTIAQARRAGLNEIVVGALGRVGAPPFFAGLAGDVPDDRGVRLQPDQARAPNATMTSRSRAVAAKGETLSFSESRRAFATPSARYFVHLKAPGWNVAGATAPWLPGVAIGHNERVAWAMTPIDSSTWVVHAEEGWQGAAARGGSVLTDAIVVKGRRAPFEFTTQVTPLGVVIALDREHRRAFTLSSVGLKPGTAAELGAIVLDRAHDWTEFQTALFRWKMPARTVVYVDVDGTIGSQPAGEWIARPVLTPIRTGNRVDITGPGDEPARTDAPVVFPHVLGITDAARRRFAVGPVERRRGDDSAVQGSFDPRDWDRSTAINAPGQSESSSSPHARDLAELWSRGASFPLVFSDAAVAANAESTLRLVPPTTSPR